MKKGRWIAAGISATLVGALAIGLGAAQAKSSGSPVMGRTGQMVATCEAMHESMHSSSGDHGSAQCQAIHDQMAQMMGSGMMGAGSGMMSGQVGGMMGSSSAQPGSSMASHHGSGLLAPRRLSR